MKVISDNGKVKLKYNYDKIWEEHQVIWFDLIRDKWIESEDMMIPCLDKEEALGTMKATISHYNLFNKF